MTLADREAEPSLQETKWFISQRFSSPFHTDTFELHLQIYICTYLFSPATATTCGFLLNRNFFKVSKSCNWEAQKKPKYIINTSLFRKILQQKNTFKTDLPITQAQLPRTRQCN